jgi:hypothetical protein
MRFLLRWQEPSNQRSAVGLAISWLNFFAVGLGFDHSKNTKTQQRRISEEISVLS